LHAPGKGEKYNLEIRHYGTKPLAYQLYDDDGVSFDYELGMFSWRTITITENNGKWQGTISKSQKGKPDGIGRVTWKFMGK